MPRRGILLRVARCRDGVETHSSSYSIRHFMAPLVGCFPSDHLQIVHYSNRLESISFAFCLPWAGAVEHILYIIETAKKAADTKVPLRLQYRYFSRAPPHHNVITYHVHHIAEIIVLWEPLTIINAEHLHESIIFQVWQ